MRINVGDIDPQYLIEYLQEVLSSEHPPIRVTGAIVHFPSDAWEDIKVTEAFYKLSTCMESCGCTGYDYRASCPDQNCFCNGVTND